LSPFLTAFEKIMGLGFEQVIFWLRLDNLLLIYSVFKLVYRCISVNFPSAEVDLLDVDNQTVDIWILLYQNTMD
jgi:hypothetical protein